jgi:hypothetical protein
MVILFDATKVQQLLDIRKSFCKYFYFYGDFYRFFTILDKYSRYNPTKGSPCAGTALGG